MRARVRNQLAGSPVEAIERFTKELSGTPTSATAARYGLVLALTDAGRTDEAALELDSLWAKQPDRLEYMIADAKIKMARGDAEDAAKAMEAALRLRPNNHPLTITYAEALMQSQQPHIAEEVLLKHSREKPNDPYVWYLLAEVQGLSGNIIGLHQARAEYFILNGVLDQAEKQLRYALDLQSSDYTTNAKITQRLRDIGRMREVLEG